jgi:hypothetical protein
VPKLYSEVRPFPLSSHPVTNRKSGIKMQDEQRRTRPPLHQELLRRSTNVVGRLMEEG